MLFHRINRKKQGSLHQGRLYLMAQVALLEKPMGSEHCICAWYTYGGYEPSCRMGIPFKSGSSLSIQSAFNQKFFITKKSSQKGKVEHSFVTESKEAWNSIKCMSEYILLYIYIYIIYCISTSLHKSDLDVCQRISTFFPDFPLVGSKPGQAEMKKMRGGQVIRSWLARAAYLP